MNNILVVDDNLEICQLIKDYGEKLGYQITSLSESDKCLELLNTSEFDLIILDVAMPHVNGFELYIQIVDIYKIPILFLSAKSHPSDRIKGLKLGAEDYVVKPFSLEELFIKIERILSRKKDYELVVDNFKFNLFGQKAWYKDQELRLTQKEYKLLIYLVENKGKIVSRDKIMHEIWQLDYYLDTRTLDTHIKSLRKQLDDNVIKTVRGEGYCYENNKE